jgi:hypothetical protein
VNSYTPDLFISGLHDDDIAKHRSDFATESLSIFSFFIPYSDNKTGTKLFL